MMKGLRLAGFLAVIALLTACNAGQAWQKRTIANKENTIMEEAKKGKIDTSGVKSLLVAYDAFVKEYPLDTNSANFLFKEADFYRYLHQPKKSVEIYAGIYNNYPQYFKRPYALFMQGFIYENEIHNLDSAKLKYETFLRDFPKHPIAKDVAITLSNLGKSPEQMMKEFEERQQADSLAKASK